MTSEPLTIHSDTLGPITVTVDTGFDFGGYVDKGTDASLYAAVVEAFTAAGGYQHDPAVAALIDAGYGVSDAVECAVVVDGKTYGLGLEYDLDLAADHLLTAHEYGRTVRDHHLIIDRGVVRLEVTEVGPAVTVDVDLAYLDGVPDRRVSSHLLMLTVGQWIVREWGTPDELSVEWVGTGAVVSGDVRFDIRRAVPSGPSYRYDVSCRNCACISDAADVARGMMLPGALNATVWHMWGAHPVWVNRPEGVPMPASVSRVTFVRVTAEVTS